MANFFLKYFFCWFVIFLCLLVLIGWQFDVLLLRSIIPDAPQTTPLTVLFVLALAIALAISGEVVNKPISSPWVWIYKVISAIAVLAALWTGIQYIFHLPPSIEIILYPEQVKEQSEVLPGRPSPRTVLSTFFIGLSIFLAISPKQSTQRLALVLSMIGLIFPWIALFGYTTMTREFYLIPGFPETGMSPISAIAFIMLSFGAMSLWPDRGIIGLLRASSSGGTIVKILLPIVTLVPLLLSWVVSYAKNVGYFDLPFGLAVNWGLTTLLMAGMIIWGGALIHKRDLEKEKLHYSLMKAGARFRTLIEAAPDAIIILNEEGKIVLINEQTEKLFGYTRVELIDQQVEILMPKKYGKKHEQHRSLYYQSPKTRMMGEGQELKGKKKDGSEFPVEIALSPIEMEEEVLIFAAVRDITDRKQREEENIQYLKNLELAQKIARMGYFETDVHLGVCKASDNFCRLFGLQNNTFTEEEFQQLVHPDDFDRVMEEFSQSLKEKENFQTEYRLINPQTKEILSVKSNSYFTYKEDSQVDKVIGIKQDITQQKKIETEILELNHTLEQKVKERTVELEKIRVNLEKLVEQRTEQLQSSNQELEAFSYSVSHDLRAPLRAITGYSNILIEDYNQRLDDEGKRVIAIINRNVDKMGQLIDDILTFSRLSRAGLSYYFLDMKALFQEAYRNLRHLEDDSREIEFFVDDLPSAKGDRMMVMQAITNLISNALKYTLPKKKAGIHVGYKVEDGKNVYYIKDNGVGFDERHKGKLFEVFQRLHKESEFEGTGVGLAIVQRVIYKHGGKVWGESVLGEGASFYFTLS